MTKVSSLNAKTRAARENQASLPVKSFTAPIADGLFTDISDKKARAMLVNVYPSGKLPEIAYVPHDIRIDTAIGEYVKACEVMGRAEMRAIDIMANMVDTLHTTKPSHAEYMATQARIRAACGLYAGFREETAIKAYRQALARAHGELPVSDSPEAIRKAAARAAAKKAATPATEKSTATPATPATRTVTETDAIGQFIATFGAAAVLTELAKILATEKSTATDARALQAIAGHLKAA